MVFVYVRILFFFYFFTVQNSCLNRVSVSPVVGEVKVCLLVEQKNRAGLRKNKVEGCRGATAASSLRTPRDLFSSAWQARANELIAKGDGYTEKRRRHRDLCYCGNE